MKAKKQDELVLDDGLKGSEDVIDERSTSIGLKAGFYLLCFIAVSCLPFIFLKSGATVKGFLISFAYTALIPLALALALEFFRKMKREKKESKGAKRTLKNPFWFEVLESGFAIFFLIFIVTMAGMLLPRIL